MAHGQVFDLHRGDPFAARLDHVLGPIGDVHHAVRIDRGHVPGVEEAIGIQDVATDTFEIAVGDDGPARLQSPECLAVLGEAAAIVVGDLQLAAELGAALLQAGRELLLERARGKLGRNRSHGGHGRSLGHAPEMADLNAVAVMEAPDDRLRASRAADRDPFESGQPGLGFIEILQQPRPNRGYGAGNRDAFRLEQLVDRGAVELGAGHDQLGADGRRTEGHAPGVGVEHGGHRQNHVGGGEADDVRLQAHQRVQEVRPMGIHHALGIAGGA